jgi:hypothetical protein
MKPTRYLCVVALAACSSAPGMHWEKSGASEASVKSDSAECRDRARFEAPQPNVFAPTGGVTTRVLTAEEQREQNELEYFQKCMRDKGYSAKR